LSLISHNVGKRKEAIAEGIHLLSNINHGDERYRKRSIKSTGNIHMLRNEFVNYEGRENLEGPGMSGEVILNLIK
jgi:hypothetical protein